MACQSTEPGTVKVFRWAENLDEGPSSGARTRSAAMFGMGIVEHCCLILSYSLILLNVSKVERLHGTGTGIWNGLHAPAVPTSEQRESWLDRIFNITEFQTEYVRACIVKDTKVS